EQYTHNQANRHWLRRKSREPGGLGLEEAFCHLDVYWKATFMNCVRIICAVFGKRFHHSSCLPASRELTFKLDVFLSKTADITMNCKTLKHRVSYCRVKRWSTRVNFCKGHGASIDKLSIKVSCCLFVHNLLWTRALGFNFLSGFLSDQSSVDCKRT